jgi:hypothetical protein
MFQGRTLLLWNPNLCLYVFLTKQGSEMFKKQSAKTKNSRETIPLRRVTWLVWQVNLLTTVLNDSPVLPEEDDTPSMYRAIKEKDFYENSTTSNGKSIGDV